VRPQNFLANLARGFALFSGTSLYPYCFNRASASKLLSPMLRSVWSDLNTSSVLVLSKAGSFSVSRNFSSQLHLLVVSLRIALACAKTRSNYEGFYFFRLFFLDCSLLTMSTCSVGK
jgi:hypothetical protein